MRAGILRNRSEGQRNESCEEEWNAPISRHEWILAGLRITPHKRCSRNELRSITPNTLDTPHIIKEERYPERGLVPGPELSSKAGKFHH